MDEEIQKIILRRLSNLEQHIVNLIIPIQEINEVFSDKEHLNNFVEILSKPLQVDDEHLCSVYTKFKDALKNFESTMEKINIPQTYGEIKYIGKKLFEIESRLDKIEKQKTTSNIQLDVRLDGQNMVAKPLHYDSSEQKELNHDGILEKVLSELNPKEKYAVIHRLGLFGEKEKTFGKINIKVTHSRNREIYVRALRKIANSVSKEILDKKECAIIKQQIEAHHITLR